MHNNEDTAIGRVGNELHQLPPGTYPWTRAVKTLSISAGHLRHRAHLLLCCFDHLMRIFAFFMLDCLVWFDLGSIPFWSQDRSRIVQNQSKSVQNRSKIGSKSVQNQFKIGPKSILERSWGVLGRPGAAWGYLVRFLIENRGSLDPPGPPSWVPKSTQID